MTHPSPDVTVVIPCYNYAHYLRESVGSVQSQEGVSVEIIIVDDCSTDDSLAVARELAESDERITVIAHATNQRHIRTYNDGLARARGMGVVLLSADDLLAPGSLARSVAVLRAHPRVGLVYGYAEDFEGAPPAVRTSRASTSVWSGARWLRLMCRRGSNLIVNPEAIVRGTVLERIGLYDEGQPQSADMDLWMRAAAVSDVARVNGPQQAFYRVHGANMHLNTFAGIIADISARRLTFRAFFAGAGAGIHGAERLARVADRALTRDALNRSARLERAGSAEGREVAQQLIAFATETDAALAGARLRLRRSLAPVLRRAALGQILDRLDSLRWALAWRRWRRWGI